MRRFFRRLVLAAAAMVLALRAGSSAAPEPVTLRVGYTNGVTSVYSLYVGVERGYFKDEGIDIKMVPFTSGGVMPPALATGELDVAAGALSPGFYNLLGRGLKVQVVATGGAVRPPLDPIQLTVRKDLGGTIRSFRDLKGHTVSAGTRGATCDYFIRNGLAKAGLSTDDVRIVYITASDQAAAYGNKSIDAGCTVDPFASNIIKSGLAVRAQTLADVAPGLDNFALMYADTLAQHQDVGDRFMIGYLRAARAIAKEGFSSPAIVQIIQKWTEMSPDVLRAIVPPPIPVNCYVSAKSINEQLDFWQREGLLDSRPDPAKFINNTFCDKALAALGRPR